MKLLRKLLTFVRPKPKPLDAPVIFSEEHFQREAPEAFSASWSDVQRITGYKIDMFAWDEIRVEFALQGGNTVVVSEESPGFPEFMAEVERRFPSAVGWHSKISQPAFAPCTSVLHVSGREHR